MNICESRSSSSSYTANPRLSYLTGGFALVLLTLARIVSIAIFA
jgi:hypothetical protein